MNKRGQTLILFIILIPILLGFGAFIVDVSLVISKNVELKEVSKTIIKDVIDQPSEEKVNRLFLENHIPTDQLKVQIDDDEMRIQNEYKIESIFGAIIGIKDYDIKVDIVGILENEKVIFE